MKLTTKLLLGGLFYIVLFGLGMVAVWYFSFQCEPEIKIYSQGRNAVWARHDWVGKSFEQSEYYALGAHSRQYRITDIYFHVGPLNAAGSIEKNKYPYAERLISMLKSDFPDINLHAWIGQIEKAGGGPLDLSDPMVRLEIVRTAKTFLNIGFDGIHYNIEPLYTGNRDFIDLLWKTKQVTTTRRKILSLACDDPEPFSGANALARMVMKTAGFWKIDYYQEIAQIVDQLAVMMYDTAIPYNWVYAALVQRQTRQLLNAIPPTTILYMGVPSYDRKSRGFHPEAENVDSSLKGLQWGIQGIDPARLKTFGIAVYARWTTDEDEWALIEREWLQGTAPPANLIPQ